MRQIPAVIESNVQVRDASLHMRSVYAALRAAPVFERVAIRDVRGDADPVDVDAYLDGLRAAGVTNVEAVVVPHSGHSASLESPHALWETIEAFAR